MKFFTRNAAYLVGSIIGIIYGLSCQYGIQTDSMKEIFYGVSIGFVFILPILLGSITVYFGERNGGSKSWISRIFMPWLTALLCLFLAMITGLEGTICLIMAVPIYLPLASLGGIVTGTMLDIVNPNKLNSLALSSLLLLPFIAGGIEEQFSLPEEIRQVDTSIIIEASPAQVWKNIARIPKITEPQESFFYYMGFPRPVEATLSKEAVGGIREAKFEKGLMFIETITEWEPDKKLTFTIRSEPEKTPLTTLDSHIVVGGRYFDTLLGEYDIEKLSENRVVLKLFSRYRLSTRFNFYAEIWSDFLMRDIQKNILNVLKMRIEKERSPD